MNIYEITTVTAGFLAGLWTLVQIIAYAREKDPKNLTIALLLIVLLLCGILAYHRVIIPTKVLIAFTSGRPPAASPPPLKRAEVKSSFVVEIRRNILGGIDELLAHCTFAEIGGVDVEIISYSLTVHYLESTQKDESEALTRSFERTLEKRVRVPAGGTDRLELKFDKEIGDLVLKCKKSGKSGWTKIVWTGKDAAGNIIKSESTANKPG